MEKGLTDDLAEKSLCGDHDASFYIHDLESSEDIKVLSGNSTECHVNPQLLSPLKSSGSQDWRDLDHPFDSPFKHSSMPKNFYNSYDFLSNNFITDDSAPDSSLADDSFFNFDRRRKPKPPSRASSVGSNSSQLSHPPPSRPRKRRRTRVNIDSEELTRGIQSWDDGQESDMFQGSKAWKDAEFKAFWQKNQMRLSVKSHGSLEKKNPGQAKTRTSSIGSQDDSINTILNPAQYEQRLHKAESMYFECRTRLISELGRVTPGDELMHSVTFATFQELYTLGINYRQVEANQLVTACLKDPSR